jgi:hypothetical protein
MRQKLIVLLALLTSSVLFQGCIHTEDISNRSPYSKLMGENYILEQDCYIMRYIGGHGPLYVSNSLRTHFLPKNVSPEFIQKQFRNVLIVGILRKGAVFTIVGCEEERSPESTVRFMKATFKDASFRGIVFDVYNLTDITKDPPEFFKDMARPL